MLSNSKKKVQKTFIFFFLFALSASERTFATPGNAHILYWVRNVSFTLVKFQPDSFKTKKPVFIETDGQTDMARHTRLTLWGLKRLLHGVANF